MVDFGTDWLSRQGSKVVGGIKDRYATPDPTAPGVAAAGRERMANASPFLGNAEAERLSQPEKPYVEDLANITLDQEDLYGTMASRGAMFDPAVNAQTLRDVSAWYDSQLGDQEAALDDISTEALNGPLASARASDTAMTRALSAARGAAMSGRGDAALMLREADFVQGAANRYAREQAQSDALAEMDARRGVAGDATMAAAGLEDAAAKVTAAAQEAAAGIESEGALTKADAAESAARGQAMDLGAESDLALIGSDLEGRGLDTREDIGNTMFETGAGIERIAMGQGVRNAERDLEDTRADWRTAGTIAQIGGDALSRMAEDDDEEEP